MSDKTGIERRESVRLPKNYTVELRKFVFPLWDQPTLTLASVDISQGGLKVCCPESLDQGEKLQVKVYIPSLNKFHPGFLKVFESDAGQSLTAIAEVVHVERKGGTCNAGLRFVDVDEDDWKALHGVIVKELVKAE